MNYYLKFIFDYSKPGKQGSDLPYPSFNNLNNLIPDKYLRKQALGLPEVSELDVVRHYTNVSMKNYGVETGFYPLGSCTMKYNPKLNEYVASLKGFKNLHPLQDDTTVQGALQIYYETAKHLCTITGMEAFSLNPYAGAHGELSGLMIIKKYHFDRKDYKRTKILIPDSAHGTNPASASLCNYETIEIPSNENGCIDLEALKNNMSDEVAGIMLTNPNTLGIFEKDILEISEIVHQKGGLLYYDGANLNALLGKVRPGDMGFDVIHLNLHKTFSTPHGGGGPGSGPVGVCKKLIHLLPNPIVVKEKLYHLQNNDQSIGSISSYLGNFNVIIKAYCYILSLGKENISKVSELAVLNANYIKESLKEDYDLFINNNCMHEVVFNGLKDKSSEVKTLDIAKRLLDYGYHAPTIYFPLLAPQAMMIEPSESESKETLDEFIKVMKLIAKEAKEDPQLVKNAPHNTIIKRLDEVKAIRQPILKVGDIK